MRTIVVEDHDAFTRRVPGDAEHVRPLLEDPVSMGTTIASNVMVLHMTHVHERADQIVVVNTVTGEAITVSFLDEG